MPATISPDIDTVAVMVDRKPICIDRTRLRQSMLSPSFKAALYGNHNGTLTINGCGSFEEFEALLEIIETPHGLDEAKRVQHDLATLIRALRPAHELGMQKVLSYIHSALLRMDLVDLGLKLNVSIAYRFDQLFDQAWFLFEEESVSDLAGWVEVENAKVLCKYRDRRASSEYVLGKTKSKRTPKLETLTNTGILDFYASDSREEDYEEGPSESGISEGPTAFEVSEDEGRITTIQNDKPTSDDQVDDHSMDLGDGEAVEQADEDDSAENLGLEDLFDDSDDAQVEEDVGRALGATGQENSDDAALNGYAPGPFLSGMTANGTGKVVETNPFDGETPQVDEEEQSQIVTLSPEIYMPDFLTSPTSSSTLTGAATQALAKQDPDLVDYSDLDDKQAPSQQCASTQADGGVAAASAGQDDERTDKGEGVEKPANSHSASSDSQVSTAATTSAVVIQTQGSALTQPLPQATSSNATGAVTDSEDHGDGGIGGRKRPRKTLSNSSSEGSTSGKDRGASKPRME